MKTVLYRQKEADKNAMVFVCNRMSCWEAGILPTGWDASHEHQRRADGANLNGGRKSVYSRAAAQR